MRLLNNRFITLMLQPNRAKRALHRRLPNIIQVASRATSKRIKVRGKVYFKKVFKNNKDAIKAYECEIMARNIFRKQPWLPPIVEKGKRYIVLPYYPETARLDRAAMEMDKSMKLTVAKQAMQILFEIFMKGYAHCDFHAENLFWIQNRLVLVDFERMRPYPKGFRPPFPECYDITGHGFESSDEKHGTFYNTSNDVSLVRILGIPVEYALESLKADFITQLRQVSSAFRGRGNRHTNKAQRIYGSFSLPYLTISKEDAQCDTSLRLNYLCIDDKSVRGKSVLGLGSNIGAMIFELQKFAPGLCLGVEYDGEKVALANRITAYNGLKNVQFLQGDIEKISSLELIGPFDVVFCFAVKAHIKKKRQLYSLLAEATSETLYFEGNSTTDPDEARSQLLKSGFKQVELIGFCDDDCLPENNQSPSLVARK